MVIANRYKVSARQWKKWNDQAKLVFNEVYMTMVNNQDLFLHPSQDAPRKDYWKTTAWNAAWMAAEAAQRNQT